MGDLFRREAAETPQPFTGERLTGAIGGQVEIEHYHRYLFARAFCHDRDVLDVASGEGYGSAQLAQVARSVTGVEFDADTVRAAGHAFVRPNLRYLQGDARRLPLPDDCVDVVVSFETIEHFDRQDTFVAEVRRVLRPRGVFVVSTPDRDIYSGPNTPANPFHVKELTLHEFHGMLAAVFPHVAMLRQRPMVGSALLGDAGSNGPPLVFDRRGTAQFEACDGLPRAPYLVALASDQALPRIPASLYIDRSDLDTAAAALQERSHALACSEAVAAQLQIEITNAHQVIAELQARERELHVALKDAHAALDDVHASLARSQSALEQAQSATVEADARATAAAERAKASEQARALAVLEVDAARHELNALRGSARTFLRHYLPRLRSHLARQRGRKYPAGG